MEPLHLVGASMPVIQVNISGQQIVDLDGVRNRLRHALAHTDPTMPIVAMIHGYKFSPFVPAHDPHTHILSSAPSRTGFKAVSWPKGLGADAGSVGPICLAIGWEGRASPWQAYDNAAMAGHALADVIRLVREARPGQMVDVLAHSFGASVALSALPHLPAGAMGQMILMAPAELRKRAMRALDCPAGRAAEVIAITSRENDLFDGMLEWLVAPHCIGDRALSHGPAPRQTRWTTIQIDDPETRRALAEFGHRIPAPDRQVCHWSVYVRTGLFSLYRAIYSGEISLPELRAKLPKQQRPRWSRLFQLPAMPSIFPTGRAS